MPKAHINWTCSQAISRRRVNICKDGRTRAGGLLRRYNTSRLSYDYVVPPSQSYMIPLSQNYIKLRADSNDKANSQVKSS